MKMKFSKSFLVTVVVLLVVGERLWYDWNQQAKQALRAALESLP